MRHFTSSTATIAPAASATVIAAHSAVWRFYLAMSAVLLLVVLVGFSPTLYLRTTFGSPPLSTAVWLHGAVLTAWFAGVLLQTGLIAARRTSLHRRLGWAMAAIGVGVVISGGSLTMNVVAQRVAAGFDLEANIALGAAIFWSNLASLFAFTVLLACAVAWRRRAETHKRLMLLASISIIQPALARIARWPAFEELGVHFLVLAVGGSFLFVVALAVYDVVSRGAVHRATVAGGTFFIAAKLAGILFIAGTDAGRAIVRSMA